MVVAPTDFYALSCSSCREKIEKVDGSADRGWGGCAATGPCRVTNARPAVNKSLPKFNSEQDFIMQFGYALEPRFNFFIKKMKYGIGNLFFSLDY